THLALAVLVRALAITDRPAEAGERQPGSGDHTAVGVVAALGPRDRVLEADRGRVDGRRRELLVVVAGHVHQRLVRPADQVLEVVEGQVAAGDDQVGPKLCEQVAVEGLLDLVRDGQDAGQKAPTSSGCAFSYPLSGEAARMSRPQPCYRVRESHNAPASAIRA